MAAPARLFGFQELDYGINGAGHAPFLGGGFGRRFELDFITQAMIAAKAMGVPVKLMWSREEDTQHDFFRPPAVQQLSAGLDADGKLAAFKAKVVSPSIMSRVFPQ